MNYDYILPLAALAPLIDKQENCSSWAWDTLRQRPVGTRENMEIGTMYAYQLSLNFSEGDEKKSITTYCR